MTYTPTLGESIQHTAQSMLALAKHSQTVVTAEFNGILLHATQTSTPTEITAQYWQIDEHAQANHSHGWICAFQDESTLHESTLREHAYNQSSHSTNDDEPLSPKCKNFSLH